MLILLLELISDYKYHWLSKDADLHSYLLKVNFGVMQLYAIWQSFVCIRC